MPSWTRTLAATLAAGLLGTLTLGGLSALATGCQKKAIPPRTAPPSDPMQHLQGGKLVFEETFSGTGFSKSWNIIQGGDWSIVDGWAHSKKARNKGLWLAGFQLPDRVRIEFDIRSEPRGKKRFEGDTKCEVFATEPAHEKGYILVNGGWNNQLDIIARLDEHGKDRKERAARPVEASKTYRWAVVRTDDTLYWFRDGALFMFYQDAQPVKGKYFGFNNWEAHLYVDNLKVFQL